MCTLAWAHRPGLRHCFEVACEPPAVYTALWESFPGHLSWPELCWSTGQDPLAQLALSSVTHSSLSSIVSHYCPPYMISIYFCPPVPSPQPSSFSSENSANKTQRKNLSSRRLVQTQSRQTASESCTRLITVPISSEQMPAQSVPTSENVDGDPRSRKVSRVCSGQTGAVGDVDQTPAVTQHSVPAAIRDKHPLDAEISHPL